MVEPSEQRTTRNKRTQCSATIEIVPSGDIILIVGPMQLRLRVFSQVLKIASKPFSLMLSPAWNLRQDLIGTMGKMPSYSLPEDNAIVMKHTCAVIHHQKDMSPQNLGLQELFDISTTAIKYMTCLMPWNLQANHG
ncbi:uncharacterized protein N7511_004056 [Penicillium nucicola]|uniref:uncharacterized protein n=1 Tax=Penicillium nucicola TaxID=1850975 RepID=UPI0025451D77|nr:uncharacterized protein N7511_004056 [Penicillium nucicola]KAJ5766440.1 hypothetical protein N7511_004056 [Penicillium nucicola]